MRVKDGQPKIQFQTFADMINFPVKPDTAGLGVDELSARYFLAPKSIQRILTLGRRGLLEP